MTNTAEIPLRRESATNGMVHFRVPASWKRHKTGTGATFVANRTDGMVLYVNVKLMQASEQTGAAELARQMADDGDRIVELPNGKVMTVQRQTHRSEGFDLLTHVWMVAAPLPPSYVRLAVFTCSCLAKCECDPETAALLQLLEKEVADARFPPPRPRPAKPWWKFWAGRPRTAAEVFEEIAGSEGLTIESVDDSGLYRVKTASGSMGINLDNVQHEYLASGDWRIIRTFIRRLNSSSYDLPAWEEARDRILYKAAAAVPELAHVVHDIVTEKLWRAAVIDEPEMVRFVRPPDLQQWGIGDAELHAAAEENMARLLLQMELQVHHVDGKRAGFFTEGPFSAASAIFCSNLKTVVSERIGWPVLAVVPNRDRICLVAEADVALLERISGLVCEDMNGPYALTPEVLRISDDGIECIGICKLADGGIAEDDANG